jgi:hypothetical protein
MQDKVLLGFHVEHNTRGNGVLVAYCSLLLLLYRLHLLHLSLAGRSVACVPCGCLLLAAAAFYPCLLTE